MLIAPRQLKAIKSIKPYKNSKKNPLGIRIYALCERLLVIQRRLTVLHSSEPGKLS